MGKMSYYGKVEKFMRIMQKSVRIEREGVFLMLIVFVLVSSFFFIHTAYADTYTFVTPSPYELTKKQAESIAHEFLKAQFAVHEEEIEKYYSFYAEYGLISEMSLYDPAYEQSQDRCWHLYTSELPMPRKAPLGIVEVFINSISGEVFDWNVLDRREDILYCGALTSERSTERNSIEEIALSWISNHQPAGFPDVHMKADSSNYYTFSKCSQCRDRDVLLWELTFVCDAVSADDTSRAVCKIEVEDVNHAVHQAAFYWNGGSYIKAHAVNGTELFLDLIVNGNKLGRFQAFRSEDRDELMIPVAAVLTMLGASEEGVYCYFYQDHYFYFLPFSPYINVKSIDENDGRKITTFYEKSMHYLYDGAQPWLSQKAFEELVSQYMRQTVSFNESNNEMVITNQNT